jgi:mannosyltransferase
METTGPSRRSTMIAAMIVFALAVILRVPSCYESFWLDELHSAWCVWGSLGEVFLRADLGHQSPFYFVGLWFWKQVVGGSELALRLSSVLAVSASGVVLTIGVTRWTKSVVAGATAGFIIAVESNSLFFGTELRPYALVILFASFAVVYFLRLASVSARREDHAAWTGIVVAILLAMLCQPTAMGVLAWLPLVLLIVWLVRDRKQVLQFSLADSLLVLSATAVAFALWRMTLGETWQQRSQWASFAKATYLNQIWEVWDWTWLLVVPLSAILVIALVSKIRGASLPAKDLTVVTLLLAVIAVLATSLCWFVSWADWIPLWHRRYFVAVLPIFACTAGGAIGVVNSALLPYRRFRFAGVLVASAMVLALASHQGTLARLPQYPVALVTRGEDWRAAIDWVRRNVKPNDLVFLDAGLVEADALFSTIQNPPRKFPVSPSTTEQLRYLNFAVSGPYDVRYNVVPISRGLITRSYMSDRRLFVISRQPAIRAGASQAAGASQVSRTRVFGLGNVSVKLTDRNSGNP